MWLDSKAPLQTILHDLNAEKPPLGEQGQENLISQLCFRIERRLQTNVFRCTYLPIGEHHLLATPRSQDN